MILRGLELAAKHGLGSKTFIKCGRIDRIERRRVPKIYKKMPVEG